MTTYTGACHCGAITIELETKIPAAETQLRACQCKFCRMHQALAVSDPDGKLTIRETEADTLNLYRFALSTSDFLICSHCGAYAGATMERAGMSVGILNIRLLSNEADFTSEAVAMDYGGENSTGRIARRLEKWMPIKVIQHAALATQNKDSC